MERCNCVYKCAKEGDYDVFRYGQVSGPLVPIYSRRINGVVVAHCYYPSDPSLEDYRGNLEQVNCHYVEMKKIKKVYPLICQKCSKELFSFVEMADILYLVNFSTEVTDDIVKYIQNVRN